MESTNVNINLDSELRNKAQSVLDATGLDISTMILMLLRREFMGEDVSFAKTAPQKREYSSRYLLEPDTSKVPTLGEFKGLMEVPVDFCEPVEDMKEYMP